MELRRKKRITHPEDDHQIALIEWATVKRLPALANVIPGSTVADYLFHIPNGGSRGVLEAIRFKRMGLKAGVSDLLLPIPVGTHSGLWVEMKAPYTNSRDKNYPTKEQRDWQEKMSLAGYRAEVCYGWLSAKDAINNYLAGE